MREVVAANCSFGVRHASHTGVHLSVRTAKPPTIIVWATCSHTMFAAMLWPMAPQQRVQLPPRSWKTVISLRLSDKFGSWSIAYPLRRAVCKTASCFTVIKPVPRCGRRPASLSAWRTLQLWRGEPRLEQVNLIVRRDGRVARPVICRAGRASRAAGSRLLGWH